MTSLFHVFSKCRASGGHRVMKRTTPWHRHRRASQSGPHLGEPGDISVMEHTQIYPGFSSGFPYIPDVDETGFMMEHVHHFFWCFHRIFMDFQCWKWCFRGFWALRCSRFSFTMIAWRTYGRPGLEGSVEQLNPTCLGYANQGKWVCSWGLVNLV